MEHNDVIYSALKNYDLDFITTELFSKQASIVYKLVASNSQKFALKIYENASNINDNELEILTLEAITKKGTIRIPEVIKNKEGKYVTTISDTSSNTFYRIVLSKWLEGIDLKNNESEEIFFKLGQLVAELHLITKDITIPKDLQARKWDSVFYFRDEKVVYHDKKHAKMVSEEFKELMDAAIPIFNLRLEKIYQSAHPQLLHGDLNPWNIKIHDNQISILDFEDLVLAHPVHDLAILLSYYKNDKNFEYANVKKWVLNGYDYVNPHVEINEKDLEFLSMARTVNLLNYVLTLDDNHDDFIKSGLASLKAFLESE